MSNACVRTHTCSPPPLATSEKLGRTAAWHYEQVSFAGALGQHPQERGVPTHPRQLQQVHSPVPNGDQGIFILLCAWCPLLVVTACGWPGHAQGLHVVGVGVVSDVVVQLVCSDHVGGKGQRAWWKRTHCYHRRH